MNRKVLSAFDQQPWQLQLNNIDKIVRLDHSRVTSVRKSTILEPFSTLNSDFSWIPFLKESYDRFRFFGDLLLLRNAELNASSSSPVY